MLERILRFAVHHRWLVVLATAAAAAYGLLAFQRLPIDAVPDISPVQVQISTVIEGFSPGEVEKLVTVPIETTMRGIPGVTEVRSFSRYGLSQVSVIFRDGTNIYFARQLVNEHLEDARAMIPAGLARPAMG